MKRILIIGGGAAGTTAAVAAAQAGAEVTVAQRSRKTLRKLAASGNGRGNLLNRKDLLYPGGAEYAKAVLRAMPVSRVETFWHGCGVPLTEEEEGRVYPGCFSAAVAAEALRQKAEKAGVRVLLNTRVTTLKKTGSGFIADFEQYTYAPDSIRKSGKAKPGELLSTDHGTLTADRVILTAGGAASPVYGTDGTAYSLAQGHQLTPVRPALCALMADGCGPVSGQRIRAGVKLVSAECMVLAQSRGEVLFAQDGISGIAAMQLARAFQPGCSVVLDLSETVFGDEFAQENAVKLLQERLAVLSAATVGELLCAAMTPSVLDWFLHMSGLRWDEPAAPALHKLAAAIQGLLIPVTGVRGFELAQVTAGGLRTDEFTPESGESRLCPGLYAAGEILDVDGECGGFNLMFAVASGLLCGEHAAR